MAAAAHAQTNSQPIGQPSDPLLNLLIKKGYVTLEEAQQLRAESEAIQTNNAPSFSKWKIGDGIKSVELFGDIRLRYESRQVRTLEGGKVDLDRFRYALRLGLRGDLASEFYYGLRLETSSNPRSPWVTFATSSSGVPYQGPFGKSTAGIDVGQIYIGWHPISAIDVTVGKMPMPLFTTPMVWDSDINPEGAAEHFKYDIGPAEFFANFGQFMYQDDNPSESTAGLFSGNDLGHDGNPPFMMAWQGGVKYQVNKDVSFKAAGTIYNYLGHGTNTAPGSFGTGTPGYSDTFVGEGSSIFPGASGYSSGSADGFTYNQTGINNLLVLEFPFEVNFKLLEYRAKLFGDFALNLDGADRAEAAVAAADNPFIYSTPLKIPLQRNQYKAYQVGLAVGNGNDLGLVYGSALRRGAWEARVYWQHIEQYALDPNLLDSDFFEGRGNLEGLYSAFSYGFTSALIGTVRYGFATRIDENLGTGGSNQDIPQVNPINHYQLVQLDLTLKF
jgi:Putative porin